MRVPRDVPGRRAYFRGPCRSAGGVVLAIDGTVVAPPAVGNASWITFHYAHGLAIRGGTLDGNGHAFWACKAAAGRRCPPGTTVICFKYSKPVICFSFEFACNLIEFGV